MTQVKYNDQKWWVLLNGSWMKIPEKDWEKVWKLIYHSGQFKNKTISEQEGEYSLPEEVEFEIKAEFIQEKCGDSSQ